MTNQELIATIRAEVGRRMRTCDANSKTPNQLLWAELAALIPFLDTLQEQKVDFEKEIDREWMKCLPVDEGMGLEIANIEHQQFDEIACYFYELGKNAKDTTTD